MAAEPNSTSTRFTPWIAGAALGALVGTFTTYFLISRASSPLNFASAAEADRKETDSNSATEVELRRLAEKLDTLVAALQSRRERAESAEPGTDAWLAQLEALVSRYAHATAASVPRNAPLGTHTAALHSSLRADLLAALNLPDREFPDAREALGLRLDGTHRLWPMSEVLATYGQPTRLNPSDLGLYLDYELDPNAYQDISEPPLVRFLILEGVVASVQPSVER